MARRLGLTALASLPLWGAMLAVWLFAQDLSEMAAAAIAAGLFVTLLGLGAIAVVTRRSERLVREHDLVVSQSLALVDCMKEINRRVMRIECGAEEPEPVAAPSPGPCPRHAAPLAMATTLTPPPARNDDAATGQPATALPQPEAISAADIEREPVVALETGDIVSYCLALGPGEETPQRAKSLAETALAQRNGALPVEMRLPTAADARRVALLSLACAAARRPDSLRGLLLGLDRAALHACVTSDAPLFAALAQAGLRLSLYGAPDFTLTGAQLMGGAIARLTVDGQWLATAIAATPDAALRWSTELAEHRITLCARNVADARMARLLAAFDVRLASGPGAAHAGEEMAEPQAGPPQPVIPRLPWRAAPRRRAG